METNVKNLESDSSFIKSNQSFLKSDASHMTFTGTHIEIVLHTGAVIATIELRFIRNYPYFRALFNEEMF
jgi:hypothetical protein